MTSHPVLDDRDDAMLAEIVDALVEIERAEASLAADKAAHLARAQRIADARSAHQPVSVRMREMEERCIAAEIGVATRTNDRAVQNRMHTALTLCDDYPATLDALADGAISARHAAIIREAGSPLRDADTRARYEDVVLAYAKDETPSRTDAFARKLVEQLRPESVTERFEVAEQSRRVFCEDLGDGMSMLGVVASAPLVHGMMDRLTRQGKATKGAAIPRRGDDATDDDVVHDTRTMDQIRADLVCDMLLSGSPAIDPTLDETPGGLGAIRAHVSITIPVLTAAGTDDRGALLDGTIPVDAETARRMMTGAPTWERILTHPVTGTVQAVDTYRRPKAMQRFLEARDVHCRFPGCRQPARRCDHDHNRDWAHGGTTDSRNLACLCKRHHTLKTEKPWKARQLPDGTIRWTSPLGRTRLDKPERYVAFQPDPSPPPF
jgi:hypothetical protein